MTFELYNSVSNETYDLVAYWAYGNFTSTDNDVDGSAAGRTQSGLMIRDYVATKMKWEFVSVPLPRAVCENLLQAVRPETFRVRTDCVDGTLRWYTCYSNNRVLTHVVQHPNGDEWFKVAFPIIEM